MDNQQNFEPQSDLQKLRSQRNKIIFTIICIVIGGLILMGSCVGYLAYSNAQKEAAAAKIAKEKAEEEKRELQKRKEEADRKAEEERRLKQEAEERERKEREAREEKERLEQAAAEQERIRQQEEAARQPEVEVSKVQMSTDTELVKGEFDYGVRVSGSVKNAESETVNLQILALLSCSGGEWTRTQHLAFYAGETKNLTYFFHEPSFGDSLSNCQGRIMAKPF